MNGLKITGRIAILYVCAFVVCSQGQEAISSSARRMLLPVAITWLKGIESQPVILGVDVARFGDDRTIIRPRQGRKVMVANKYRGLDTMETADSVIEAINEPISRRQYSLMVLALAVASWTGSNNSAMAVTSLRLMRAVSQAMKRHTSICAQRCGIGCAMRSRRV